MTEAIGVDRLLKEAMACSGFALLRCLPAPAKAEAAGRARPRVNFGGGSLNHNITSLPGKGEGTDPPHVNRA